MIIEEQDTETKNEKILIAEIDGSWSIAVFREYLKIIEQFSVYFNAKSIQPRRFRRSRRKPILTNRIPIKSIQYNSPGWIEVILPATSVVSILAFLKHYIPNSKERAEIKKIRAEAMEKEIKNLKELGFSDNQIKKNFEPKLKKVLSGVAFISALINQGYISSIDSKDNTD